MRTDIAVIGAALAIAMSSAMAQGKPKPPADKAPDVQEKGAPERPHPTVENFHAQCIGCHGIPGYKTAFPEVYHVPRIAGQQPGYIIAALKAYKSGRRNNAIMKGFAGQLSKQDIEDLAAWFSSQPRTSLHDQR